MLSAALTFGGRSLPEACGTSCEDRVVCGVNEDCVEGVYTCQPGAVRCNDNTPQWCSVGLRLR